jgi:hypothetical protein
MTAINVQFSDPTEKVITSVFGCPQDPEVWPNQGQIDSSDPRYLVFIDPAATTAGQIAANEAAIQAALDAMAQERGYDDIKAASDYASDTPAVPSSDPHFALCEKFRLEGNALKSWRSTTWAASIIYLATVNAGTNPMPTPAQAVAMMPTFVWPD